jgi:hypothetical protein
MNGVESNPLPGFMIAWLATDISPSTSDSGAFGCQFLPPNQFRF